MDKKKKIIIFGLQAVLIILFIVFYRSYVNHTIKSLEVYGYARSMEAGEKITETDLKRIPISQITKNSQMVLTKDRNRVIGKYTVVPVVADSILYKTQLGDVTDIDIFMSLDFTDSRVVSLPIDYTLGVAGDFRRGDRLDLMYSAFGEKENLDGGSETFVYARLFLQDILVYQVNTASGHRFVPHAHQTLNEAAGEGGFESISSISIVVSPEQAEQIEARRLSGNIGFVKRFENSETYETLGYVIGNLGKVFAGEARAETGNISVSDSRAIIGGEPVEVEEETPQEIEGRED